MARRENQAIIFVVIQGCEISHQEPKGPAARMATIAIPAHWIDEDPAPRSQLERRGYE
jgi:hypothetical protein